jgi:hypothetical protein
VEASLRMHANLSSACDADSDTSSSGPDRTPPRKFPIELRRNRFKLY